MKLCFADTETTGLDNRKHEMFQIALIIEIDGKVVDEAEIKIRPTMWDNVSEDALRITGKTIEELKTYPDPKESYKKLIEVLGRHIDKYDKTSKLCWVGQNAPFDMGFMRVFFNRAGDKYFGSWFENIPMELITLTRMLKVKGYWDLPNYKLVTVCEALKIPLKAHDALEDIRATRAAYHKIMSMVTIGAPLPLSS